MYDRGRGLGRGHADPSAVRVRDAGQVLADTFDRFSASLNAAKQQIVNALQQADSPQDIAGLRAQIIGTSQSDHHSCHKSDITLAANSTVLYPILAISAAELPPPYVQITDFFVTTCGTGNAIQAAVLQPQGGALNLPPGNDTIRKEVFIKGPTASSTRKALEALLHYTEKILSGNWGYMDNPSNQYTVAGPNGAWHYKRRCSQNGGYHTLPNGPRRQQSRGGKMASQPPHELSTLGDQITALVKDHLASVEKRETAKAECKKAEEMAGIGGMREQILDNVKVLYPLDGKLNPGHYELVGREEFIVTTVGDKNVFHAEVVYQQPNEHYFLRTKTVFLRGPDSESIAGALMGLLCLTTSRLQRHQAN
ncbi:hypothetical protein M409DRAFT_53356 [Zasmidium cellare ATCC 36951]|uniref:Uncharacterized protein n=1 Tax=Zasmidium cellare ATCC 36951 TaxID=1080233 RepID=A0A6A6CQC2_ZASCE|nr:uncharacterized protein M409DRAFT_53356 [Zasmidium cellare ATCC 36951]KAF2168022.1 hypothetical protein M409DRAFT_53356 [Zasmidium cellare ATCC 36951]